MNCTSCGIEYKDDVPHPPNVCLETASVELKKAKTALDGALDRLSAVAKERDDIKALVRKILSKDGKIYALKGDHKAMESLYKLI